MLMVCVLFVDSVEEGEKLVQTALENFGRIGQSLFYSIVIQLLTYNISCNIHMLYSIIENIVTSSNRGNIPFW